MSPLISNIDPHVLLDTASRMMDELMNASTQLDYAAHVRHFTARAKAALPEQLFLDVCHAYQAQHGVFTQRKFIKLFVRKHSALIIWQQHFSQTKDDYMAEMLLVLENGALRIDHVMVR